MTRAPAIVLGNRTDHNAATPPLLPLDQANSTHSPRAAHRCRRSWAAAWDRRGQGPPPRAAAPPPAPPQRAAGVRACSGVAAEAAPLAPRLEGSAGGRASHPANWASPPSTQNNHSLSSPGTPQLSPQARPARGAAHRGSTRHLAPFGGAAHLRGPTASEHRVGRHWVAIMMADQKLVDIGGWRRGVKSARGGSPSGKNARLPASGAGCLSPNQTPGQALLCISPGIQSDLPSLTPACPSCDRNGLDQPSWA